MRRSPRELVNRNRRLLDDDRALPSELAAQAFAVASSAFRSVIKAPCN